MKAQQSFDEHNHEATPCYFLGVIKKPCIQQGLVTTAFRVQRGYCDNSPARATLDTFMLWLVTGINDED